jgi:hypothetical protein
MSTPAVALVPERSKGLRSGRGIFVMRRFEPYPVYSLFYSLKPDPSWPRSIGSDDRLTDDDPLVIAFVIVVQTPLLSFGFKYSITRQNDQETTCTYLCIHKKPSFA